MSSAQVSTRLHISPLTSDLLPAVLGPNLIKAARNASYHDIQTYPEKLYGYIELPVMEADKVKKKLHGAILKGKKMKIEDARPKKRKHPDIENDEQFEPTPQTPREKKSKKSKNDRDALQGHELSPDRKVKRGWTEQKSSSKKEKKERTASDRPASKYTDKEELLFRTKLPDNKAELGSGKMKKSKKPKGSHTVHEFEKSVIRPSFLKSDVAETSAPTLEYVDGQGWVDAAGNVIEKEPPNLRERRKAKKAKGVEAKRATTAASQPESSQIDTSVLRGDEGSSEEANATSSEDSTPDSPSTPQTPQESRSAEEQQQQLHPLEALFKKPQKPASSQDVAKPSLEVHTGFSFFGAVPEDDIEEEPTMPGTPFSSQDVRSRGLRSAAPTPDTAHPSRFNSYGSSGLPGDEELESDEEDGGQNERKVGGDDKTLVQRSSGPDQSQSDFVKMFWEKRGEHNSSWKARRRSVLKEKRQRENRARRPKNW